MDSVVATIAGMTPGQEAALLAFLRTDLDYGFTLVNIARDRFKAGRIEQGNRCRDKALKVLEAVDRFVGRLQAKDRVEITECRCLLAKAIEGVTPNTPAVQPAGSQIPRNAPRGLKRRNGGECFRRLSRLGN